MSWDHAENNERRGPVVPAEFDALVRSGTVGPGTLVWREGMPNWKPLAEVDYQPPRADAPPPVPGVPEEMGVCSESGRILPRSELVEIDGRLVSAEYKNVVLQRIREGVPSGGAAADPEAIAERIEAEGWTISVFGCVGRGWALVKQNYWLITGATFLVYLLVGAAGVIPLGGLIVQGPLFGGLYWLVFKLLRREPAAIGDAFEGFSRGWGQLIGAATVPTLLAGCCLLPGAVMVGAGSVGGGSDFARILGGALILPGAIASCYLIIAWSFAVPLVMDKRLAFWAAMELSRRVVRMHWWKIFGVFLLVSLFMLGAVICCGLLAAIAFGFGIASRDSGMAMSVAVLVGLLMALVFFSLLPLFFSAIAVAYEEIFGPRRVE